jgi:hypothetical protein
MLSHGEGEMAFFAMLIIDIGVLIFGVLASTGLLGNLGPI